MHRHDEPALEGVGPAEGSYQSNPIALRQRIERLFDQQVYGVLCTQGSEQPYGSVVAFAATEDLHSLVFCTPVTTRKYRLLTECPRVAMVIDNRSRFPEDLTKVEAVTATGIATPVPTGAEFERLASLLISRHPHLEGFVFAQSTALFRVDVFRYFHVVRFQEVNEWVPASR